MSKEINYCEAAGVCKKCGGHTWTHIKGNIVAGQCEDCGHISDRTVFIATVTDN